MQFVRNIQPHERALVLIFFLQAILIVYFVHESRFLYGDGSNFFTNILKNLDFSYGGRASTRQYGNLFTQLPLMVALKSGVTDFDLLKKIYGASLFFPYVLCISVWFWVIHKYRSYDFLIFPALLLFASASNSLFYIISESHIAAALFFALIPLILFHRPWGVGSILLAVTLALPLLRAYESMVFFGPVLTVLALHRATKSENKAAFWGWVLFGGWFLAAAYFALIEIIAPSNPRMIDTSDFAKDTITLLLRRMLPILLGETKVHFSAVLSFVALVALCFGFLRISGATRIKRIVVWAFGLICSATLLLFVFFPELLEIRYHYRARTLNVIIPFLVCISILALFYSSTIRDALDWRYAFIIVTILGTYQLGWHAIATRQWAGYLEVFVEEVSQREGYILFSDSRLNTKKIGRQAIENLNYGWTNPTMSILVSPDGKVQSIVGPKNENRWQPFDPLEPEELPDLARYGFSYDLYLKHVQKRNP